MDTEQIVALAGAVAALLTGGTYGGVRIVRSRQSGDDGGTDTTDVLLARIGELETALAAERARASALPMSAGSNRAVSVP